MKVTVLLCVYNADSYVAEAIQSILDQTYRDFELVIVDDHSTDQSRSVIDQFNDSRIVRINNAENLGLPAARNRGISVAKGEYIAIMDHDDISLSDRLEKQVAFLDAHPEIGVVGGQLIGIDEHNNHLPNWTENFKLTHNLIAWNLVFHREFFKNACTMIRKNLIDQVGGYEEGMFTDDYNLWTRLMFVTQLANLPDVVLKYRVMMTAMSKHSKGREKLIDEAQIIQGRVLTRLLGENIPKEAVEAFFYSQYPHQKSLTQQQLDLALDLTIRVYDAIWESGILLEADRHSVQLDLAQKIDIIYSRFYAQAVQPADLAKAYWKSILPTRMVNLIGQLRYQLRGR